MNEVGHYVYLQWRIHYTEKRSTHRTTSSHYGIEWFVGADMLETAQAHGTRRSVLTDEAADADADGKSIRIYVSFVSRIVLLPRDWICLLNDDSCGCSTPTLRSLPEQRPAKRTMLRVARQTGGHQEQWSCYIKCKQVPKSMCEVRCCYSLNLSRSSSTLTSYASKNRSPAGFDDRTETLSYSNDQLDSLTRVLQRSTEDRIGPKQMGNLHIAYIPRL